MSWLWRQRMRNLNTQMARAEARNSSNNSGCRKAAIVFLIVMVGTASIPLWYLVG